MRPRSVYIHVPFCLHHCGYCDFTLVANRDHLIPNYLAALKQELQSRGIPGEVDTVFVGGGTPTHLHPSQLAELFESIAGYFTLVPGGEFSVEANPDGLCADRLRVLTEYGVNRLSLGVQSFDDSCLRILERSHTGDEAAETIERCHEVIPNLSIDLIFGVPGQTVNSWEESLGIATKLPLSHISAYGLTFEQGTPFFRREQHGLLARTPDETERTMYLIAVDQLRLAGFQHYEISNYCRPGFACRHNQIYWNAAPCEAFGPGAARYVDGVRTTNCRSVNRWIQSWLKGEACVHEAESLNREETARESMMLALRMIRGLNCDEFRLRFGINPEVLAGDAIRKHTASGLLEHQPPWIRLTREGLLLADTVVVDFL